MATPGTGIVLTRRDRDQLEAFRYGWRVQRAGLSEDCLETLIKDLAFQAVARLGWEAAAEDASNA